MESPREIHLAEEWAGLGRALGVIVRRPFLVLGGTLVCALVALVLLAAACTSAGAGATSADDPDGSTSSTTTPAGEVVGLPAEVGITAGVGRTFPPAPEVPTTDTLDPETQEAFDFLASTIALGEPTASLVDPLADTGDARFAWAFADLMRFYQGGDGQQQMLVDAIEELTGMEIDRARAWPSATDHLIAWDLPAPPGYQAWKVSLFSDLDARWRPLIEDPESEIDYRWLNWGGVLIDDRALGTGAPCARGCIPALDDPAVTPASDGDWYPDDAIVFGVVIDHEVIRIASEAHSVVPKLFDHAKKGDNSARHESR